MKEHSLIEFEKKIFFSYARYPASEIQHLGWKLQTISVRLDFLKCVQIFVSSKTQICKMHLDLQICDAEEKI